MDINPKGGTPGELRRYHRFPPLHNYHPPFVVKRGAPHNREESFFRFKLYLKQVRSQGSSRDSGVEVPELYEPV